MDNTSEVFGLKMPQDFKKYQGPKLFKKESTTHLTMSFSPSIFVSSLKKKHTGLMYLIFPNF